MRFFKQKLLKTRMDTAHVSFEAMVFNAKPSLD
jgi:hypothetical protein